MPLNVHLRVPELAAILGAFESSLFSSATLGFRREKRNETTTGSSAGGAIHNQCSRTKCFEAASGHERCHFRATAADHAVAAASTKSRSGDPGIAAAGRPGASGSAGSTSYCQPGGPAGRGFGQAILRPAATRRRRPEDGVG